MEVCYCSSRIAKEHAVGPCRLFIVLLSNLSAPRRRLAVSRLLGQTRQDVSSHADGMAHPRSQFGAAFGHDSVSSESASVGLRVAPSMVLTRSNSLKHPPQG